MASSFSEQKLCAYCSIPLPNSHKMNAKFCSSACRQAKEKQKRYELNPYIKSRSTGKTGAMSELLVCADLLKRGYDVFRAVSQSCSCDVVVLHAGKMVRVEVKTSYRSLRGNVQKSLREQQGILHEVLALVFLDNYEIRYEPPLEKFLN